MFDHYRIPHVAFLARYAQVKQGTGEYVRPPNAKLSYGTMVFVRANIVMGKLGSCFCRVNLLWVSMH
jgi:acyl-CoA oxidase